MMAGGRSSWALAAMLCLVSAGLAAQEPIIYPAKGQSQEQLDRDKFECYSFAKKQTGFDPMATPTATSTPTIEPR